MFLGTLSKIGYDESVVEGGTGEMKKAGKEKRKYCFCQIILLHYFLSEKS